MSKRQGETKKNITRSEFIEIRNLYIKIADNSSNTFDHTIISITAGILGASMLFVNNKECVSNKRILLISRIILGLNIGVILYGFYLSKEVNKLGVRQWDEENYYDEKKAKQLKEKGDKWNDRLKIIQRINITAMGIGTIGIAIFLYINITTT